MSSWTDLTTGRNHKTLLLKCVRSTRDVSYVGAKTGDVFFQQGGAIRHAVRKTIISIHKKIPGTGISLNGDVNWPPMSSNITPFDFFLCDFLKSQVYQNKPRTIRDFQHIITRSITSFLCDMCERH